MPYRSSHLEHRRRMLEAYDANEANIVQGWTNARTAQDQLALLEDLLEYCPFTPGMKVLDVGAGTGVLSLALAKIDGLNLAALEPCPALVEHLRKNLLFNDIQITQGFCDHESDRRHFEEVSFDRIVSRQVVNTLFDPCEAFTNWNRWLCPDGIVVVMDALLRRENWPGRWAPFVDALPLSACDSMATVPYLLERCGFEVLSVSLMNRCNAIANSPTKRFMIVARKINGS